MDSNDLGSMPDVARTCSQTWQFLAIRMIARWFYQTYGSHGVKGRHFVDAWEVLMVKMQPRVERRGGFYTSVVLYIRTCIFLMPQRKKNVHTLCSQACRCRRQIYWTSGFWRASVVPPARCLVFLLTVYSHRCRLIVVVVVVVLSWTQLAGRE